MVDHPLYDQTACKALNNMSVCLASRHFTNFSIECIISSCPPAEPPEFDISVELQRVADISAWGLPLLDVCRAVVAASGDLAAAAAVLFERQEQAAQESASAKLAAELSQPSAPYSQQPQVCWAVPPPPTLSFKAFIPNPPISTVTCHNS